MELGTPKTLDEAIMHALCIGPFKELPERAHVVLKDFLAQKFGVAYIQAGDDDDEKTLNVLKNLYMAITDRPEKENKLSNSKPSVYTEQELLHEIKKQKEEKRETQNQSKDRS